MTEWDCPKYLETNPLSTKTCRKCGYDRFAIRKIIQSIPLRANQHLGTVVASGPCHIPGLEPGDGEIEIVTKEDMQRYRDNQYERL